VAKAAERESCSDAELSSGVATLAEGGDEATRRTLIQTVVVVDVTKATDVEKRSVAARCFLRGAMAETLKGRTTQDFSFVFLGKNRGEFQISPLGGSEVATATRNALATAQASPEAAQQEVQKAWSEILAGQIALDRAQCRKQLAPQLFGLGIDNAELSGLLNVLCSANERLSKSFSELAAAQAETEAGSDVYGTLDMIDDEYSENDLDLLRIIAFSDLLDFNPNTKSNLTKELEGKTREEAKAAGEIKGLEHAGFKTRRVMIYAEQPGETAGGTQRKIRPLVEEFWRAYAAARGAEIRLLTNLANAR